MSIVAGLHEPVMPLLEVPGNVGTEAPAHMVSSVPKEKEGIIFWFTVTVKVAGTAHNPEAGVKV